ncbi:MAG: dihydrofolate reductase family protein [Luteimonas sp.]
MKDKMLAKDKTNSVGRKIIVLEFLTLDGVMQAPGGPEEDTSGDFKYGGWTAPFFDDEAGEVMAQQMAGKYDLLLGRKTYEIFASYWPTNSETWPQVNKITKFVASKTLKNAAWENSVILKGDLVFALKKLKSDGGPNLQVYGSGNMIQSLLKHGLVDEIWLKIFPVTLGNGKKLFADGSIPSSWKLTYSKITKNGIIIANYKSGGKVKTGSME